MNKWTFLFLTCLSWFSSARTVDQLKPELCPDRLVGFENIQIQQSLSSDGRRCHLGVHPRDAYETLIYRDYLFTQDGLLMVFNSFSESDSRDAAGAREFYFLPKDFKGFEWKVEDSSLILTGFVGRILRFSLKTAQIEEISGAQIQVAPEVVPANKGGLEILKLDELFFDAGFKLGDSPSADPNQITSAQNIQGKTCRLKNSKVYDYVRDSMYLKPEEKLRSTLRSTCKNFE